MLPVESPEQQIPFDAPSTSCRRALLYLRSERMTVLQRQGCQRTNAAGDDRHRPGERHLGDQFFGAADVIKFDEAKQQVTLEGANGRLARPGSSPGGTAAVSSAARRSFTTGRTTRSIVEDGYSGSSR